MKGRTGFDYRLILYKHHDSYQLCIPDDVNYLDSVRKEIVREWEEHEIPAVIIEVMAVLDVLGRYNNHPVYGHLETFTQSGANDEYALNLGFVESLIERGEI
jgi:hypothetical protein